MHPYPISLTSQINPSYNHLGPTIRVKQGEVDIGRCLWYRARGFCNKTIRMPSEGPERATHHIVIVSKEMLTRSRRVGKVLRRPNTVTDLSL